MQNFDWIKLYRKFTKWEWYRDSVTKAVFLHMLIASNYDERVYRGITLKSGELLFSQTDFCLNLGLKRQPLRTAMQHLLKTSEITKRKEGKYCVVTINNYNEYQSAGQEAAADKPKPSREAAAPYKAKKERIKETENTYTELFEEFWQNYPKKKSKPEAFKVFEQIQPEAALFKKMLTALSAQSASDDWKKESGRYIPYPATWLSKHRWEDETAAAQESQNDILQRSLGRVPVYGKKSDGCAHSESP